MIPSTFTVFCQQADQLGTVHIDSVEAPDLESAILAGREQCLADWNGDNSGTDAPFTLDFLGNSHFFYLAELLHPGLGKRHEDVPSGEISHAKIAAKATLAIRIGRLRSSRNTIP